MKRVRSRHIPLRPTTASNRYGEDTLIECTPNTVCLSARILFRGGSSRGNLSKNVRAPYDTRCIYRHNILYHQEKIEKNIVLFF